jgi:hypothetical protein
VTLPKASDTGWLQNLGLDGFVGVGGSGSGGMAGGLVGELVGDNDLAGVLKGSGGPGTTWTPAVYAATQVRHMKCANYSCH